MTVYKVGYDSTRRNIVLVPGAPALPGGLTNLGTFEWTPEDNSDGFDANVVPYHFVRDKLYLNHIQDMQSINIYYYGSIPVEDITVGNANVVIAEDATSQITATALPSYASNSTLTYESSNPSIATVSGTGLITGVNAGTATITISTANGVTETVNVTVT